MMFSTLRMEQVGEPTGWLGAGKFRLTEPLTYTDADHGVITVAAGFVTDFASVVRTPLASMLFVGHGNAAGVLHDWLYVEDSRGLSRSQADAVFYRALRSLGVARWRAWCMWAAVRMFAGRWWSE